MIHINLMKTLRREKQREYNRENSRKWRAANPDKHRAVVSKRYAANPEKFRAIARKKYAVNPDKHRAAVRKWRGAHPENNSVQTIKWRVANPDKFRAIARKGRSVRRARIVGNGGRWTVEQFKALCAHFNNRCVCCGRLRKLSADHIISLKMSKTFMLPLGFLNDIDNIQPLCHGTDGCNNKKSAQCVDYRTSPHPDCLP